MGKGNANNRDSKKYQIEPWWQCRFEPMVAAHEVPMKGRAHWITAALGLFALGAGATSLAQASDYPSKPVKIITQAPAGAGPDVILRIVADRLTQMWGQQVLVINRPGGGGIAAGQAAATTSERDGHTLYMASSSALVVLPETHAKLPFSFDRDFVPIGFIGEQPFVIAVPPALKVGTLAEFIALANGRARIDDHRKSARAFRCRPGGHGPAARGLLAAALVAVSRSADDR